MRHSPFNGQFGFDLELHLRLVLSFVFFVQHFRVTLFDDVSKIGGAAIT